MKSQMDTTADKNKYRLKVVSLLSKSSKKTKPNYFSSHLKPSIPIDPYISRVLHFIDCSASIMTISLIYLKRIDPGLITESSIHRLFFCAILVANKFLDDYHVGNEFFSQVGGIKKREIIKLELAFLKQIKFDLYVSDEEYNKELENIS